MSGSSAARRSWCSSSSSTPACRSSAWCASPCSNRRSLGLALNEAAYLSEILRGGILSVAKGQTEAARALGLKPFQIFRLVVLPQALRVIIPPLGNSVNGLLKTTSIASVISMEEVLRRGQILMQQKFQVLEVFMVVAIIYLVMTTCWDFVQRHIEAYYGRAYGAAADKQLARDDH